MAIRKIKVPGQSQAVDLHDARIPGIDTTPASGSENLITSGAVFNAISDNSGKISYGTTAYWQEHLTFIPKAGEIVIYSDHSSIEENDETVYIPGIKIGDGSAYGIDLPFVDDAMAQTILSHISDTDIHITAAERTSWNNKLCLHDNPVVNNTLILYND